MSFSSGSPDSVAAANDRVLKAVSELGAAIQRLVAARVTDGTASSTDEVYFRWIMDEFEYSDQGVSKSKAHGGYVQRPSWHQAIIKLQAEVASTEEVKAVERSLIECCRGSVTPEAAAVAITRHFVKTCLNAGSLVEATIHQASVVLLKDVADEPVSYGAEVELEGLALRPSEIRFVAGDTRVQLRQTRREDLEREHLLHFGGDRFLIAPSAILMLETVTHGAREMQRRVEQAVALLRLFRSGSVKYISYRVYTDSLTDMFAGGIMRSGDGQVALNTAVITDSEASHIQSFWSTLAGSLPHHFYEPGASVVDHLSIAYNRYCDSLLERGALERRIASAVMGLESLFLKGGEIQELSYRLGLRMARVLSFLGFDPYEIRDTVAEGYKIRSLFVHGAHLSYRETRRLDMIDEAFFDAAKVQQLFQSTIAPAQNLLHERAAES